MKTGSHKRPQTIKEVIAIAKDTIEFNKSLSQDVEDVFTAESFGEDSSVTSFSKMNDTSAGANPEHSMMAGSIAAFASVDYARTAESFTMSAIDSKVDDSLMTVESFSSAKPADVASYNFGFNYGMSKQEPLVEGFFPTIIQPIGTRSVSITLDVDYIVDPYSRLSGTSGAKKDNAVPFVKTINDDDFYENRNELLASSDRKVEWDGFFVKALEAPAKDVLTGETVQTAPFVAGVEIPLLDLGQTTAEAARGEFDHKTQLAPFPQVSSLVFKVVDEYFKIGTGSMPLFSFTETIQGDDLDIGLSAGTQLTVTPSSLKDELTGANLALVDIPVGYRVIYDVLFQGSGNLRDGVVSFYVNRFEVASILDAGGIEVMSTDANYATYKAAADKLSKDSFVGQNITSHIVNDDLSRTGKRMNLRTKSQKYVLTPNTPITFEAPLKALTTGRTDAVYIPFMVKNSLVEVNSKGIKTIKNFANFLRSNIGSGALDIDTVGISRYMITPWFKSINLDLSSSVDSVDSSGRQEDIKATFDNNVKVLVSDMISSSGYDVAVEGTKSVIDIAVGVHTSLAAFIGDTVDLGNGYDVRVYATTRQTMFEKVYIVPANFASTRNTEIDVFSFGAHFYTPVLIGERNHGFRELTSQIVDAHAIFTPLLAEMNVTGLVSSVSKIAQNHRAV